MGFTTSYANTILSSLVSGAYVALTTSAPSASDTGSTIALIEPSSSANYARVEINGTNGNFKADACVLTNQSAIYFPEADGSWGTITHMCFVSSDSGGDLRYFGAVNGGSGVTVNANTVPLFRENSISISLDAD